MKPALPTLAALITFGLAGAACAQDQSSDTPGPAATEASAPAEASGFNLKMPGEAAESGYDGFNLSIPGEEPSGFRLPDDARSDNAFADLPAFDPAAPVEPAAPAEDDDLIRLD